jgi:hypothetical protein
MKIPKFSQLSLSLSLTLCLTLISGCSSVSSSSETDRSIPSTSVQQESSMMSKTTSPIRINAGGREYQSANGNVWSADYGYASTSSTYTVTEPIANTNSPELYQSERYGDEVIYNIPVSKMGATPSISISRKAIGLNPISV